MVITIKNKANNEDVVTLTDEKFLLDQTVCQYFELVYTNDIKIKSRSNVKISEIDIYLASFGTSKGLFCTYSLNECC